MTRFFIFSVIGLLLAVTSASRLDILESESESMSESDEVSEDSYQESDEDLSPDDIILRNLKELLRYGDPEYDIPVWAPFVDEIEDEDFDGPIKVMLEGLDDFDKVHTALYMERNAVEFKLFFPQLDFMYLWTSNVTEDSFIAIKASQINTTFVGTIEYEPQSKCVRLLDINVDLDYDLIDYDIIKRGDVPTNAEDALIQALTFFRVEDKEEILETAEGMIEEEIKEVFDKLQCWTYSEEKLLVSITNDI
ncbi:uncharacterized protein LOC134838006 [Culicoides brevitarsis]|uniref:uncharacterized protein LOC134838006 n=1 Tax=Culicoides brevitarsis TaxID=469753 RepID=UPI00307C3125